MDRFLVWYLFSMVWDQSLIWEVRYNDNAHLIHIRPDQDHYLTCSDTSSKISAVDLPMLLTDLAIDGQTCPCFGSAAEHLAITSSCSSCTKKQVDQDQRRPVKAARMLSLTFVPCCFSNFNHQAQRSPLSLSAPTALLIHNLAFSILRSFINSRPTALMTRGCSDDFLMASTERPLRC